MHISHVVWTCSMNVPFSIVLSSLTVLHIVSKNIALPYKVGRNQKPPLSLATDASQKVCEVP